MCSLGEREPKAKRELSANICPCGIVQKPAETTNTLPAEPRLGLFIVSQRKGVYDMKISTKWNRRIFALALGTVVVGTPLFAVHAEEGVFSRHDEHRYDVRRGRYEKDGGSDTEVAPGKYADERRDEHRDKRRDEQKGENRERKQYEEAHEEHGREREKAHSEEQNNGRRDEHRYDVRRGRYEKEGGSDTEVRRGRYEQPGENDERRSLAH